MGRTCERKLLRAREAQIRARSRMYMNSAREAFERGKMRSFGIPDLPQYPGDGKTECLCITSPESPVLTKRGWVPMLDVEVGEEVWTHRERWRRVSALVVKPSSPGDYEVVLRHPSGAAVSSTSGHLWWTAGGWVSASELSSIDSPLLMCYPYAREVTHEALYPMRANGESGLSVRPLQVVQVGVSLREAQRLESRGVQVLQHEPQGQGAVGRSEEWKANPRWFAGSWPEPPYSYGRSGQSGVASEVRRAAMELVLGRRPEEDNVPLPVDVDHGERPDPGRARDPSHQPGRDGRPTGELGIDDGPRPCQAPRSRCQGEQQDADMDLPDVRHGVPAVQAGWEGPQVLLGGVLPSGTAIYDLTVEEDHSFCIAGFYAHNTNCKCWWEFEVTPQGINAYWKIDWEAENCQDCIDNHFRWDPYFAKSEPMPPLAMPTIDLIPRSHRGNLISQGPAFGFSTYELERALEQVLREIPDRHLEQLEDIIANKEPMDYTWDLERQCWTHLDQGGCYTGLYHTDSGVAYVHPAHTRTTLFREIAFSLIESWAFSVFTPRVLAPLLAFGAPGHNWAAMGLRLRSFYNAYEFATDAYQVWRAGTDEQYAILTANLLEQGVNLDAIFGARLI